MDYRNRALQFDKVLASYYKHLAAGIFVSVLAISLVVGMAYNDPAPTSTMVCPLTPAAAITNLVLSVSLGIGVIAMFVTIFLPAGFRSGVYSDIIHKFRQPAAALFGAPVIAVMLLDRLNPAVMTCLGWFPVVL